MKKIFLLLSVCISFMHHSLSFDEKPIVIIIPSYNNAQWVMSNMLSVLRQDYTNYRIIYIDDCSQDHTAPLAYAIAQQHRNTLPFILIANKTRRGALANLYDAIHSCADEEIIVTVDGDDWLANDQVLKKLNKVYSTKDVWLTHGRFLETASGWDGWCIPVPMEVVKKNAFRTYRCPSHLRTFYAKLFKSIKKEDLMYKGEFFAMTWDQAMLFPMLEMAGERHRFVNEILYVYNTTTPINDNKVNPELQRELERIIRTMPHYERLDKLF